MTLDYISGFFDADGSITMCRSNKNDIYKAIKIDFANTHLSILLEIQKYLLDNHNLKSHISTKSIRKVNHSISYTLSVGSNQKCLQLCRLLNSHHPIKKHRINTILKYHDLVIKRNGKYNTKEHIRRIAYERLFFSPIFQ